MSLGSYVHRARQAQVRGWFTLPEAQRRAVPAGGTETDTPQMGPK